MLEEVKRRELTKPPPVDKEKKQILDLSAEFSKCELASSEEDQKDKERPELIVEPAAKDLTPELVLIQAEDYGGGIALPHYGYRRPSVDYFNSNLMSYNFVIADISSGENNVYFYDERGQGKGADALCSLRIRYHLQKMEHFTTNGTIPTLTMSLLDNCVGQNKSQHVMMFASLLSLLFYDTVAYMYFLPGHTHMHPDRVVGWCKQVIRGLNLYTSPQIVEECQAISSVNAVYLQGNDADFPFRAGWGEKLSKWFKRLPDGYTSCYFFEFSKGYCTYRHLATTPDSEAHTVHIYDHTEAFKKRVMVDFFSCSPPRVPKMKDLTLPRNPGCSLPKTKLVSLAKKYFSISVKYRPFYPEVLVEEAQKVQDSGKKRAKKRKNKAGKTPVSIKKRKVGRPKSLPPVGKGIVSVASDFRWTKDIVIKE